LQVFGHKLAPSISPIIVLYKKKLLILHEPEKQNGSEFYEIPLTFTSGAHTQTYAKSFPVVSRP
jgi:hypothetical protein